MRLQHQAIVERVAEARAYVGKSGMGGYSVQQATGWSVSVRMTRLCAAS